MTMNTTTTTAAEIAGRTGADPVAVEAILVGCAELIPEMRSKLAELTEWMRRVEPVLHIFSGLDEGLRFEVWRERYDIVERATGRHEVSELLGELEWLFDVNGRPLLERAQGDLEA